MNFPREPFDIAVVGGGPVGLHAALKGAVLNHSVVVVDKGRRFSRMSQAEEIANVPGDPFISGPDLIERCRRDVRDFEKRTGKELVTFLDETEATGARREDGTFRLTVRPTDGGSEREVAARTLVLATGLVDRKPGIGEFWKRGHATLSPYVHRGEVGYCVLCEGWTVEGKRTAVVGSRSASVQIAVDLERHFGGELTLITDGAPLEDEADAERLKGARVELDERVITELRDVDGVLGVAFEDGTVARFDKAFIALGWYKVMNELAVELGADTTGDGYVVTDENSEVLDKENRPIRGLFAAGDLRAGRWKQVVVGWGDAETAVVTAYAYRLPDRAP